MSLLLAQTFRAKVSVKINEETVKLQLDTGASVTLISESTWKRIGSSQLNPPTATASRLQCWSILLMGYSFDIEYKSTQQFGNADGLSRLHTSPDEVFDSLDPGRICVVETRHQQQIQDLPLNAGNIAQETAKDTILKLVKYHTLNGWPNQIHSEALQPYFCRRHEISSLNGCLLWGMRVIFPKNQQLHLLHTLHETHLGKVKINMLARSHFWWPKLDEQIEKTSDNYNGMFKNVQRSCPSSTSPMAISIKAMAMPTH